MKLLQTGKVVPFSEGILAGNVLSNLNWLLSRKLVFAQYILNIWHTFDMVGSDFVMTHYFQIKIIFKDIGCVISISVVDVTNVMK